MGKRVGQASTKISKNEKNLPNSLTEVLRPKVYITEISSFKRLVQELTGNGRTIPSPPPPLKSQKGLEIVEVVNVEAHGELESRMETSLDASVYSSGFRNQFISCTEELNQSCNHGEPNSSMETFFDESVNSFEVCNQLVSYTEELNQSCNHGEPDSSMESSFDASVGSFELRNQVVSFTEELKQPYNHREPNKSMETFFDASVDSFEFCDQLLSFTEELNQPHSKLYFDHDISSEHDLSINKHKDMLTDQDFESLLVGIEQYPFSSSCSQTHQMEEVSIYDYELSGIF
ncbi:hypothetical protein SADUNF_Sadunf02G0049000 [Salix dunnii]|uniref:VQ domain-containing protein n=1 Tax=Salix dunnii TaxID=1413687 RepID=A0A835N625_9ROSI|nr:hypothetical protein SADUNF_Sadunf02G0049000 [Salix dunnii]